MHFREAKISDISQMHEVRMSVRENILNNPELVRPADYLRFLTTDGKGWLCEADDDIVGFAIIDLGAKNIWALFVHPDWEAKGIGKSLHNKMLDWYFSKYHHPLWLTTAPGTRAEKFYTLQGWVRTGMTAQGEIRFEMRFESLSKF